ncbi:MAG TPA: DUF58 domain-containing protein [Bacillota bacterium]|nr:DUF58 domain-containing protein [Bacillota bacterium]
MLLPLYDLLLLFLWLIDLIISYRVKVPQITREVPKSFYRTIPVTIKITIRNETGKVRRISVRDNPPLEFAWDPHPLETTLRAFQTITLKYDVQPKERGAYQFEDISWRIAGPLGLWIRPGKTRSRQEVLVYPDNSGVKRYDLALRKQRWIEMGFRHMRLKGEGVDLRELREYQVGDDIRKIDWKASARMGHPIVREYEPERGRDLILMLDAGRLMVNSIGDSSRLELALSAVLSLAYVGLEQGDRVGVIAFADEVISYVPPAKGKEHLVKITQTLFRLQPQEVEADYEEAFRFLMLHQRKRSVVCVFTELTDEASSKNLIRQLTMLSRHHRAISITMRDPAMIEPIKSTVVNSLDVYRQAVSLQMVREREKAKKLLSHQDIGVLDAYPDQLSSALINHYLTLRRRGLI